MSDYLTTDGRGEVQLMLVLWSDWFGGRGVRTWGPGGLQSLLSYDITHPGVNKCCFSSEMVIKLSFAVSQRL